MPAVPWEAFPPARHRSGRQLVEAEALILGRVLDGERDGPRGEPRSEDRLHFLCAEEARAHVDFGGGSRREGRVSTLTHFHRGCRRGRRTRGQRGSFLRGACREDERCHRGGDPRDSTSSRAHSDLQSSTDNSASALPGAPASGVVSPIFPLSSAFSSFFFFGRNRLLSTVPASRTRRVGGCASRRADHHPAKYSELLSPPPGHRRRASLGVCS